MLETITIVCGITLYFQIMNRYEEPIVHSEFFEISEITKDPIAFKYLLDQVIYDSFMNMSKCNYSSSIYYSSVTCNYGILTL